MNTYITTPAREVTGPELLGALTERQADLLAAKFRAAYVAVSLAKDGEAWRSADWDSLDALWADLHGLATDTIAAGCATHLRETDAEIISSARRFNHLKDITAAEHLLAAERTAGTP